VFQEDNQTFMLYEGASVDRFERTDAPLVQMWQVSTEHRAGNWFETCTCE